MRPALRSRLLANGTITGLVATRVDWGLRPANSALPAIVLTKAAPGQDWTFKGPDTLINPWVQFDCYGATQVSALAVADALQAEMQRLTEVTVGGWKFLPPAILVSDDGPNPEDMIGGGVAYRIRHDYQFWVRPA
jgi:hypothetical protein